jgi:hypothetical protein
MNGPEQVYSTQLCVCVPSVWYACREGLNCRLTNCRQGLSGESTMLLGTCVLAAWPTLVDVSSSIICLYSAVSGFLMLYRGERFRHGNQVASLLAASVVVLLLGGKCWSTGG